MKTNSYEPNYGNWIARDTWTKLEAACVMNGLDPKFTKHDAYLCGEYYGLTFPSKYEYIADEYDIICSWKCDHPMSYINRYLLEGKAIPQALLELAKQKFKRGHSHEQLGKEIAPQFQEAVREISSKKESTYLALIGILIKILFTSTKHKRGENEYNINTITNDLMNFIARQTDQSPHGLGKTNLQDILKAALENWKRVQE